VIEYIGKAPKVLDYAKLPGIIHQETSELKAPSRERIALNNEGKRGANPAG